MHANQLNRLIVALSLLAGALTLTAAADGLAVDIVAGNAYVRGTWANYGYSFVVNEPIRVDALGLWDLNADGLTDEHPVGLWNSDGELLAQATVGNSSELVASVNSTHGWRFESISPIELTPGTYKLGAYYPTNADPFVVDLVDNPATLQFSPHITFGEDFVTTGGTEFFTEPNTPTGVANGYFGPNARFSAVPEPTTLVALLVAGLACGRRR